MGFSRGKLLVQTPALLCVISALSTGAARAADTNVGRAITVCGPTCVQHVLLAYGQEVELVELVAEIQGGDAERNSSMFDLKRALESRGVSTAIVDLGVLGFVGSHCPAIIHYRRGHFAVVEAVSGLYAKVVDGPGEPGTWKLIPSVMMGQSGVVLLTSKSAISQKSIRLTMWPRFVAVFVIVVLGATGWLLVSRGFLRKALSMRSLT